MNNYVTTVLSRKQPQKEDKSNTNSSSQSSVIRKFRIRHIWLYPLIVLAIFLLSSMFINSQFIRLLLSSTLALFPWIAITSKMYSSRYRHMRTQLLVMMQTLCTSVSSGYSIEKSLLTVRPIIENTFGKKCVLINPLISLEHNINMHRDLQSSLNSFVRELYFPEIVPVFHALGISGRIGNNSLEILRSSCQMLSEMSSVHDDIDAQNAGKNAEALMLCLMPFAITFALNNMSSNYVNQAKNDKVGSIVMAIAFVLCIIASALLFRFMSHDYTKTKKYSSNSKMNTKNRINLTQIVQKISTSSFISSRYELFSELSLEPAKEYEQYLRKQVLTCSSISLLVAALLINTNKPLLLVIPVPIVMAYLNYIDIKKDIALRKEEIMRDIPLFLCLISTLLEAGILLPRAIEICSEAFPNNRSLSFEIKNLRALILSGVSASDAIEKLSLRVKVPEAQSALLLISRYGRLGTSEVLNLLSLQASACWNLCRNAARKKQEREALGMLLPMTLDFISVLLVATTPAIISLGI